MLRILDALQAALVPVADALEAFREFLFRPQTPPRDQLQDVRADEGGEIVITSIRATNVPLGLVRIPAGFYTVVSHSGLEWRTESKPFLVSANQNGVEWDGPIPIPSDPSADVCLEVYASFELQPMLGKGEQLRRLATTVEQLLNHGANSLLFTFPDDGDVALPCSSLSVVVKQQKHGDDDSSAPVVLSPHRSSTGSLVAQMEDATNQGHSALSCYRKHGERRDLERSIGRFERALAICPPDHPCHGAAQANMAMAKFIHYRAGDTDRSLDVPLMLYCNALSVRPVGHNDRPFTLIQMAAVYFARFEDQGDEVDATRAKELLHEATNLTSADSLAKRAAVTLLKQHDRRQTTLARTMNQVSIERDSALGLMNEDPWSLGEQLLTRFRESGDLDDLELAISVLETPAKSTFIRDHRYLSGLADLGLALLYRFDRIGGLDDFEQAVSSLRDAVDLTPEGHPQKPNRLNILGNTFFASFQRGEELGDLEQAISTYSVAVDQAPDGHPKKPTCLRNLGHSLYHRFLCLGELKDLEQAISRLGDAVDLTPNGHLKRPDYLKELGLSFMARFKRLGELRDLDDAVSRLRSAVDLFAEDDPDKSVCLSNLGYSCFKRFERSGDLSDLEEAISRQGNAIDLTPDSHSSKPARLGMLSNCFSSRFERLGELSDLEQAISKQEDAVNLTPNGRSDKPGYLINLATALLTRFEHLGESSDLDEAISKLRSAIALTSDGHPDRPVCLDRIGGTFLRRFEHFGELGDLEQAISRLGEAVDLTPDGHPSKPSHLSDLGSAFLTRFEHFGELSDLDEAISRLGSAVGLTPDDDPGKNGRLNNLANSFLSRFKRFGEPSDLEQAISRQEDAINLTPDGHSSKPRYLNNLGNRLLTRFEHFGELNDVDEAISKLRSAVDLTSDNHPNKPVCLNDLGNSFLRRFLHFGELGDLEHAILKLDDAVNLTSDGHPNKPSYLNNLGRAFIIRFKHLKETGDLSGGILRLRGAVDLMPDGHPKKPACLGNLGDSLFQRFKHFGEPDDLEQAISMQRDAVDLTPDGYFDKPDRLNDLGIALSARFDQLGESSDLDEAISRYKSAVDLTHDRHPRKCGQLTNLGNALLTRFERTGESSDLEQAVSTYSVAVDLIPGGHPDTPSCLSNLGNSYFSRFERFGEPGDLEQAISRLRNAIDLTPEGHPDKPRYLNNLGSILLSRVEHFGEWSDLDEAISGLRSAVELTPDAHYNKSAYLRNLGSSLYRRFIHRGELDDLEQAICRGRDAVDLTPDDHVDKPGHLFDLSISLRARFERLEEFSDLDQAISRGSDAVDLTPDDHPDKPLYLENLGHVLSFRFRYPGGMKYFEQVISAYSHAACASTGSTTIRFRASKKWILCARGLRHHSLLHAYSTAIGLLPQLAWIGFSLQRRYRELIRGADVVREAAAAALNAGLPNTAVEWLEQGRSIVWGELLQLRSSYDELSAVHPEHARRLRDVSVALEHAGATGDKTSSLLPEHSKGGAQYGTMGTLEQRPNRYRTLAIKRDELLREIRGLPGFERFLLHKEFSQLRASAHPGPVVILNAAQSRCDGLIILAESEHVIHVPLPNFTFGRCEGLQNALKGLLGGARAISLDEREGKPDRRKGVNWEAILSVLWNGVVKPILDALRFSALRDLSRIFWCPTGPFTFLPIHAAGLYGTHSSEPGNKVFEFVVSSYVPTLSILAPSPALDTPNINDFRFLAVRQPSSDGQIPLPGVETELEYIRAATKSSSSARTVLLESSDGTVEEVLGLMKESDWVHFACHGIQDATNPADSGLCLADRQRLKLSDIIALSRPRGGLAFLSACQTAMGDEDLSDEAIHIAAGMLFAGYGGVVGTMWSISDRLAPRVAKDVYEQLFRDGAKADYRGAARALHDAVGHLRDSGASFAEWLPFIHVGL